MKPDSFKKFAEFELDEAKVKKVTGGVYPPAGGFREGGTWLNSQEYCSGDTWFVNPNGTEVLWYAPDPFTSYGLCHYAGNLA